MAQVDSENSISTPALSTRRRFLSQSAGVAASGAVLALGAIPPASALAEPTGLSDPGFGLIDPDARLLELEEKIFEHKEAFDALEPEIDRLNNIWCKENRRMHDEYEATRIRPTFEEREAILAAMPEFKEYMRLRDLQEPHRERADELVKQMWEIKAQTPEGRRAKVLVLLGYVMESDEWRTAYDPPCVFDVTRARDLMIEFVGGEPSEQLREQLS